MATVYTVHYDSSGETGVLGVFTRPVDAQLCAQDFYPTADPAVWEEFPGGQLGGDDPRVWPTTWLWTVSDVAGDEQFAVITEIELA